MGVVKNKRAVFTPGVESGVETASTGTNLVWNATHALTLSTAAPDYNLEDPDRAGQSMDLMSLTGSSGNKTCTVTFASTGKYFAGSSGQTTLRKLTINAGNEGVTLVAQTTAIVFIKTNTNSVAVATT